MRVPLTYQKIPDTHNCPLKQCLVFEKYDGTNLHWVLNPKFGWIDYGTRRDRFPFNIAGGRKFEQAHPELSGVQPTRLWYSLSTSGLTRLPGCINPGTKWI
jgi:hypothetical protein